MTQPTSPSVDGELEMASAALVALAEHGIPHDIQELLVHGSKREGVAPGAFSKAVRAVLLCSSRLSAPRVEPVADDDEDHMEKIGHLISRLQEIKDQWGDTCVYIRRGGLSWGAVALNRQGDDKKHGVFDLQAQHDRDMLERLEQIGRLRKRLAEAEQAARDASPPSQPDTGLARNDPAILRRRIANLEAVIEKSADREAAQPDTADGAEIVFLDQHGEQHRLVYDISEDRAGLGSGWFLHDDDPFASQPDTEAADEVLSWLVDWTYLHALEGEAWPSTKTKDWLIAQARIGKPTQHQADAMKHAAPKSPALDPATVEVWQSIETAPKDGTKIIFFSADKGLSGPGEAVWDVECKPGYWWAYGASGGMICYPTHWMPLPSPPRALAGKEGA